MLVSYMRSSARTAVRPFVGCGSIRIVVVSGCDMLLPIAIAVVLIRWMQYNREFIIIFLRFFAFF